jgi:hypothetical protein
MMVPTNDNTIQTRIPSRESAIVSRQNITAVTGIDPDTVSQFGLCSGLLS